MEEEPQGSLALVESLSADLRSRLDGTAPIVVYAWTRRVHVGTGMQMVMCAKLFRHHRSEIVEAQGLDADHAYARLVERCVDWISSNGDRGGIR